MTVVFLQAQSLLKERVREISHLNDVIETLREDRERGLATLKHYGLQTDQTIDVRCFISSLRIPAVLRVCLSTLV